MKEKSNPRMVITERQAELIYTLPRFLGEFILGHRPHSLGFRDCEKPTLDRVPAISVWGGGKKRNTIKGRRISQRFFIGYEENRIVEVEPVVMCNMEIVQQGEQVIKRIREHDDDLAYVLVIIQACSRLETTGLRNNNGSVRLTKLDHFSEVTIHLVGKYTDEVINDYNLGFSYQCRHIDFITKHRDYLTGGRRYA